VKEILAGKILNYYSAISVARIQVIDHLDVGNCIHIKGHTTNFDQKVESLQIGHQQITRASGGEIAGLKVNHYVRKHDCVYRVDD
jgi:putative protease